MQLLKRGKRAVLGVGDALGINRGIARSEWRRHRLAILCYHGVSVDDEHLWDPSLFVSQDFFASRMELLAREGYRVLDLGDAVARLAEGTLPPRSVVITFDDGNADFLSRAAPVLREYDFPATVYLTTYYSQRDLAVFDVMARYLIWRARDRIGALSPVWASVGLSEPPPTNPAAFAEQLVVAVKHAADASRKEAVIREIASLAGIDYDELVRRRVMRIMSAEEVAQAVEMGFDIQLHTHRHRTPDDRDLFRREIEDNERVITELTGLVPKHFCYPQGWVQSEFVPWLRELDVRSATTTRTGLASRDDDPLLLPRVIDHVGLSETEFGSWVAGAAELLPRRRARPIRWG